MSSTGGKYVYNDDQETPNTQHATFDFGDAQIIFDVRNLPTPPEGLVAVRGPNYVGNIFFGDARIPGAWISGGFQVYKSTAGNISGDEARGAGAGSTEKYEQVIDEKPARAMDTIPHMKNFLDAVRSRDHKKLNADIAIGARSAAFCHLGNIALPAGPQAQTGRQRPLHRRRRSQRDAHAQLPRPVHRARKGLTRRVSPGQPEAGNSHVDTH